MKITLVHPIGVITVCVGATLSLGVRRGRGVDVGAKGVSLEMITLCNHQKDDAILVSAAPELTRHHLGKPVGLLPNR